ncbi:hypothetical protein F4604DRAFT_1686312 [Suillus subluteus]|nr:hypothetical protein F4604DRAFT_1686312 [Suillus subluteus]
MSTPEPHGNDWAHPRTLPDQSGAVPTSIEARAKRHIAALEEELETMKQERGTKQRYKELSESTAEQDRLQRGYITFTQVLPWVHRKISELDVDDCEDMQKKVHTLNSKAFTLKKGADAARSDDTSTLKDLIAAWMNQDFHPSPLLRPDDKQSRGFVHDVCGKLLCPSEWEWGNDLVKTGICDRTSDYIVSENSWPLFLYEGYVVSSDNLEQGLFKLKVLVQLNQAKVKMCMASIIGMRKVTPRSIAYVVSQVRFTLSSISSWHSVDSNFDYEAFWNNVVDFFENCPGPVAQHRVTKLLEWWTRKIFGTNHCVDLTPEIMSHMSITALADQRKAMEDAVFDSE